MKSKTNGNLQKIQKNSGCSGCFTGQGWRRPLTLHLLTTKIPVLVRVCVSCHSQIFETADGMKVLYDREVPFEIRNQTVPSDALNEAGTLEAIKVKILIMVCCFAFFTLWVLTHPTNKIRARNTIRSRCVWSSQVKMDPTVP